MTRDSTPFVPPRSWSRWTFNDRTFAVDPEELDSAELTPSGWAFNTVPTCVVVHDGEPVTREVT